MDSPIINLVKIHYMRSDRQADMAKLIGGYFQIIVTSTPKKASLKWVIYREVWVSSHVISILICFPVCILYYIQVFCNLHMHAFRASLSRRPQEWNTIMSVWMGYFQTGPIFGYDIMKPILKYHGNVLRTFQNYSLVSSFNLHHITSHAKEKTHVTRVPCIT